MNRAGPLSELGSGGALRANSTTCVYGDLDLVAQLSPTTAPPIAAINCASLAGALTAPICCARIDPRSRGFPAAELPARRTGDVP